MTKCKKPTDNKATEYFTISRADLVYNLSGEYKGEVYKREGSVIYYECAKHGTKYVLVEDFKGNYVIVAQVK